MGRRLILDTNVLIDYDRGLVDRAQFDDDDLAMAAISVAEFHEGIVRASGTARGDRRLAAFTQLREFVAVLDYTEATAIHHSRLLALTRKTGRPRSAHDLIIAAHAAEIGRTLVTRDATARFSDLPGVSAVTPVI